MKTFFAFLTIFMLGALTAQHASAARYSEPRKVRLWCGSASASFFITGNYSICKDRATGDTYRITNLGIGLMWGISAGIDYIDIKTSCRSIEGDLGGVGAQYVKGIGIKGEVYTNRCMRALVVGGRAGFETGIALKGMSITKLNNRYDDEDGDGRRLRYASRSGDEEEDRAPRRASRPRYVEQRTSLGDSFSGLQ